MLKFHRILSVKEENIHVYKVKKGQHDSKKSRIKPDNRKKTLTQLRKDIAIKRSKIPSLQKGRNEKKALNEAKVAQCRIKRRRRKSDRAYTPSYSVKWDQLESKSPQIFQNTNLVVMIYSCILLNISKLHCLLCLIVYLFILFKGNLIQRPRKTPAHYSIYWDSNIPMEYYEEEFLDFEQYAKMTDLKSRYKTSKFESQPELILDKFKKYEKWVKADSYKEWKKFFLQTQRKQVMFSCHGNDLKAAGRNEKKIVKVSIYHCVIAYFFGPAP